MHSSSTYTALVGFKKKTLIVLSMFSVCQVASLQYIKAAALPKATNHVIWQGINYYPAAHPWRSMWLHYDSNAVDYDMHLMERMGMNSCRIFLPYSDSNDSIAIIQLKLGINDFFRRSRQHHLKVAPTLFDFFITTILQTAAAASAGLMQYFPG